MLDDDPVPDRLPRRELVVRSMGRRVRVTVDGDASDSFHSAFVHAWGHLTDTTSGPVDHHTVVRVDDRSSQAIRRAVANTTAEITLALIDGNIGGGHLLHAGAVLERNGTATLLVGESGAGKTTAVAHLARTAGYLTDETAFVTWDGQLVPYPKPLSVVVEGTQEKAELPPADVGLIVPDGQRYPVGRIIELDRGRNRAGIGSRCERLDLTDSVLTLVPRLSRLSATPRPLSTLVRFIAAIGGVERLSYDDIDDIDPGSIPESAALEPESLHFTTLEATHAQPAAGGGPGYVRADVDAVETSRALLVADGSTVHALDGISTTLWHETAQQQSRDDLLEKLRRAHGAYEHDGSILDSILQALTEARILRRLP